MTPAELDEIRQRVARFTAAIGPGGEKAWLAQQLARDVGPLLDEVQRLQQLVDAQRQVIEAWAP